MSQSSKHTNRITVVEPKEWAAGLPAVISAYKNVSLKVGPIKGSRLLSHLNQIEGFDCPGCAWPDPLHTRATFEFCENGAKAVADEATLKRINGDFFTRYSVTQLRDKSDKWLNAQGRLCQPMVKHADSDHYQVVTWQDAYTLIAEHIKALDSAEQATFYTSGRASNEAAFLYQLFVRMLGTNNLPDCSNLCHESSGVGLTETLGVGKGTVSLDDLENADAIFIFGQNPGSNHPRMLTSLQKAKRKGAKIVAINPLDETGLKRFKNPQEIEGVLGQGTALRDLHLGLRVNGDMALLKGLCRELIERDNDANPVLDHDFINQFCHGFEPFRQDILSTDWSYIEQQSGLTRLQIQQAADIACQSQRTICCWAMGMTQHKNAVANIQLMTNFLMLRGNIGKPGAGVCPVRGHSNVQGDRTMGIWEKPTAEFLDALATEFNFDPPRHHGVDAIESIHAMLAGKIKVFCALGGNFFRANPDHEMNAKALANCTLTVQASTKLNRSHLFTGKTALILPVLGRTEIDRQSTGVQTVTVENSMGVIQTSHGKIPPASAHLKSEVGFITELAETILGNSQVDWLSLRDDYTKIRAHIAAVVPGFEGFNHKITQFGEFVLPNPVRDKRQFNTSTGKANFIVNPNQHVSVEPGQFLLMTIRSHDQFNTTIYTDDDRYRGVFGGREVIFLNRQDMQRRGVSEGQLVDITSYDPVTRKAQRQVLNYRVIGYDIPNGCAAAYYPETNNLISLGQVADRSNTPAYKSVIISIHPAVGEEGAKPRNEVE
ncbi:FdhF/YdeP family oxidoreductase [Aliiglaciecola sp. LCG003]|uniref:FdhF/YdeP family oxidoreductase n=1 Tax=Aliiglaciecola sp. LCG003 TaxID=3053655 RepID=UPI0025725ABA|nr:FdhF/YdeP family oxidoreductase [Aliiglaciecola sp. LCG003]WJG08226.1 FdhF/YdeP family oxidoreductase [Aliiglaciecola sp. LCG003]